MNPKNKMKKCKGFSLVEILIAIFVFSLTMAMLTGSFASFYKNYADSKKIQKDTENAQYAMNLMAKTLRTSKINAAVSDFPLDLYDYSQNKCIRYVFNSSDKKMQYYYSAPADDNPENCDYDSGSLYNLTPNDIIENAKISATPTENSVYGKVTIALSVKSGTTTAIPIQMTVSLRQ